MSFFRHNALGRRPIAGLAGLAALGAGGLILLSLAQPRPESLPRGVRILRDVAYVEHGSPEQTLDLYLPPSPAVRPLAIWVHGGGWIEGSKADPLVISFVSDGYALASVDYRLAPGARYPAQLEDCKAAVRWLRANAFEYGLDERRFAAMGSSAGGHLAALLGTTGHVRDFDVGQHLNESSRVDVVVDFFGPTELTGTVSTALARYVEELLGGPPWEREREARRASPLTWVAKDAAPFFIVHGDADDVVSLEDSLRLRDALARAGVPVTFHKVIGGGHGSATVREALPSARRFLRQVLL